MSPNRERTRALIISLGVLTGVFGAAVGTWLSTAEGDTAQLGAAALVLPNVSRSTEGGALAKAGGPVQTTAPVVPPAPTTSSAAPTTSSETPTEASKAPETTTKAPPPSTAKPAARLSTGGPLATQVVDLVNNERAKAGCKPLAEESHLDTAAQKYSDEMAKGGFFDHTSPDGTTFDQRIKNAGYAKPGGENIAKGQTSPAQVMDSWMNSPGHRANILNCSFTKIGVGVTESDWVWVQDFGY